jgi:hypothetical protein
MLCDRCKNEFPEGEMGTFKSEHVCFKCATDQGIPADFHEFLKETPLYAENEAEAKDLKKKEEGRLTLAFLISAIVAAAAGYYWYTFSVTTTVKANYLFVAEGALSAILVRLLLKGKGGNFQNIVAIVILISFFLPQMMIIQKYPEFDPMVIMKDFAWVLGGIFLAAIILLEIKRKDAPKGNS